MNKRYLQTLCILILQIMLLLLCACNQKEVELKKDYDFQLNMAENTAFDFAETEEGMFFVKDYYLYHIGNDMTAKPLCIRGGCLHDKNPGPNVNCDAYVDQAKGLFHYDENLFVLAETKRSGLCLTELTTDGIYVKSVSVLPASAENMIHHRGNFYYSFISNGTAALVRLGADDGKSRVIYKSQYENGTLEPVLAYDRYVYIRETDFNSEDLCCTLIYDTEEDVICALEADNIAVYRGKLLYSDGDGAWRTARLDGKKPEEAEIPLKTGWEIVCAYDRFIIAGNQITDENKIQTFAVYKEGESFFEFTLEDVDGRNWSTRHTDSILVTDEYIFFLTLMKNGEHVVLAADRVMFEQGIFEPHYLF